jgi:ribosomal protein S27AE
MDTQEFRDLLQAKGVKTAECPVCGANAWGELIVSTGLLRAVCGQCGFVLTFVNDVLVGED